MKEEHLAVFDCAFQPRNGMRSIAWQAHVLMMAAAQPFLSGAISKTVNMPRDTTPEDIAKAYFDGWKLGLKALAIYRDGSKESQPLSTSTEGDKAAAKPQSPSRAANVCRTRGKASPTSSTSPATKATSPSACSPTAGRASCSSRWPRKAARSAA